MAEVNESKRALIGKSLAELVATARGGGPRNRIGLMAAGSELRWKSSCWARARPCAGTAAFRW